MPIDFSPPSANLQGYQISSPQSTDPLQTLAQMGQLRTQNLQREGMQQDLELNRAKLDSQKGMLKAMLDSGGDMNKFQALIAQPGYNILPGDAVAFQEHRLKMQQDAATLDKTTRENTAAGIDQYRGLLANVKTPEDLAAANQRADQLGIPKTVPRHAQFSDPTHVQAFSNSLASQAQVLNEAKEQAAIEASRATKAKEEVLTQEGKQKVDLGEQAQIARELQNAELDPNTKTPTPAAMAAIRANHPKAVLPLNTPDAIARYVRSVVPAEKQPEYDINAMKANLGLMGNTEFDQYQLKYAQSLNKKPNELNFPEFSAMTQQYAKDRQDPTLLAMMIGLKGAQTTVAQGQASSILTPQQIQNNARDLLTGDIAPDQIKELRAGRVNQGAQIIEAARQMATAEGKPFSLLDLEMRATQRQDTLKEFTNTKSGAGFQRLALNTLIHHADLYLDSVAALKNGSFKPGNEIYNKVASAFGAAPPTNAALLAQFFASETGKVATGGVPAEGEIKGILSNMATAGSPEAMEGAGKTLLGIAAGRMIPLKELRDKAGLEKFVDILGPDAKAVLIRRGFDPETMKPVKPGQRRGPAPGTTSYKYNATGANDHKIGSNDGKTWFDLETGQKVQ